MTITNDMLIANIPALKLRDFLKKYTDGSLIYLSSVISELALSSREAKETLLILLEEGYIQREITISKKHTSVYSLTIKGNSLAIANATKRIKRKKVNQLISAILTRANYANNSKDIFLYKVKKIYLFGSCIDKTRADYGDIDIAVELEKKLTQSELCIQKDYKRLSPFKLSWKANEEDKLYRFLKASNMYISVHSIEDMTSIGAKNIEIFSEGEQSLQADDSAIVKGLNAIKKKERKRLSHTPDSIYTHKSKYNDRVVISYFFNDSNLGRFKYDIKKDEHELDSATVDGNTIKFIVEKFGEKFFFDKLKRATKGQPTEIRNDFAEMAREVIDDNWF